MEVVVAALLLMLGAPEAPAPSSKQGPTVLFMCPHGAAKSVMASAYFQKLAKERGLNVRVDSAGTEPDPQLSKGVVKHWTVPDFSANFDVAEQSIREQVNNLVDELLAAQRARK